MAKDSRLRVGHRVLDARRDTLDLRDRTYEAALTEMSTQIKVEAYRALQVPVLDQGDEPGSVGFGLATVAEFLLRKRGPSLGLASVSPRMLSVMAQRYDEWPPEDYEGSSARLALKGWHKHGLCSDELWSRDSPQENWRASDEVLADASRRPLAAYYRLNHQDLATMHSALAEVGILYATGIIHAGWDAPGRDGLIQVSDEVRGGHAFALVAYDEHGFWLQNSWGEGWGSGGLAHITYDDWLEHGMDVWVARLGVPVTRGIASTARSTYFMATAPVPGRAQHELRPHIISIANDGLLSSRGEYSNSAADVEAIFRDYIPRITRDWRKKRILLYGHGGLVSEDSAVEHVACYRAELLKHEVYLLSFIWHSDFWTTLKNILEEARRTVFLGRRPQAFLLPPGPRDWLFDRADDTIEALAGPLLGKAAWEEMKENARLASTSDHGGGRISLKLLSELLRKDPSIELHIAGHSAGSIFHAPIVQLLAGGGTIAAGPMEGESGYGRKISSCTLWAPACTVELFKQTYLPAIRAGSIERFALFTLTDEMEQDDHCVQIYHKSLPYLVTNAFEKPRHMPLLGMETFIQKDPELMALFATQDAAWIKSPNEAAPGSPDAAHAMHHGDFDDDGPTLCALLARILGVQRVRANFTVPCRTPSSNRGRFDYPS